MTRIRSPILRVMLTFLVAFCVGVSVIPQAACGEQDFEKVFKKSAQAARVMQVASVSVGELTRAGLIPEATSLKLQRGLQVINTKHAEFHRMVVTVRDRYGGDYKKASPEDLNMLDKYFSTEVIKALLGLLDDVGVLSPAVVQKVMAVIAPVKILITTISGIFGNLQFSQAYLQRYGEPDTLKAYQAVTQRWEVLRAGSG